MKKFISYIFLLLMRCKMSITATPRRQKITAGTKIGVILAVFGTPENEKRMLMWWRYNERP